MDQPQLRGTESALQGTELQGTVATLQLAVLSVLPQGPFPAQQPARGKGRWAPPQERG